MNDLYRIIKHPIITERGTDLKMKYNKLLFSVDTSANKREIKKAIERIFDVSVIKVNVVNLKGKVKRYQGKLGKRPDIKKAIVTLKEGEKIDILEGS